MELNPKKSDTQGGYKPVLNEDKSRDIEEKLKSIENRKKEGQWKREKGSMQVKQVLDADRLSLHSILQGSSDIGDGGPSKLVFGVNLNDRKKVELKLHDLQAKEKEYIKNVQTELNNILAKNELDQESNKALEGLLKSINKGMHINDEQLGEIYALAHKNSNFEQLIEHIQNLGQVKLQLKDLRKGIEFSKRARKILEKSGHIDSTGVTRFQGDSYSVEPSVIVRLQTAVANNKAAIKEVIIANDKVWTAKKMLKDAEDAAKEGSKSPDQIRIQLQLKVKAAQEKVETAKKELENERAKGQVKQKELTAALQEVAMNIDLEDLREQIEYNDKVIKDVEKLAKEGVILSNGTRTKLETTISKLKRYKNLEQVILRYGRRINNPAEPERKEQKAKVARDFKSMEQWIRLWGSTIKDEIKSWRSDLAAAKIKISESDVKKTQEEEAYENLDKIMNCAIEIEEIDRTSSSIAGLENFVRDNEHSMALCRQIAIYFAYSIILLPIAAILYFVEQWLRSTGEESEEYSKECKKWFSIMDKTEDELRKQRVREIEVTTTYHYDPTKNSGTGTVTPIDFDSDSDSFTDVSGEED